MTNHPVLHRKKLPMGFCVALLFLTTIFSLFYVTAAKSETEKNLKILSDDEGKRIFLGMLPEPYGDWVDRQATAISYNAEQNELMQFIPRPYENVRNDMLDRLEAGKYTGSMETGHPTNTPSSVYFTVDAHSEKEAMAVKSFFYPFRQRLVPLELTLENIGEISSAATLTLPRKIQRFIPEDATVTACSWQKEDNGAVGLTFTLPTDDQVEAHNWIVEHCDRDSGLETVIYDLYWDAWLEDSTLKSRLYIQCITAGAEDGAVVEEARYNIESYGSYDEAIEVQFTYDRVVHNPPEDSVAQRNYSQLPEIFQHYFQGLSNRATVTVRDLYTELRPDFTDFYYRELRDDGRIVFFTAKGGYQACNDHFGLLTYLYNPKIMGYAYDDDHKAYLQNPMSIRRAEEYTQREWEEELWARYYNDEATLDQIFDMMDAGAPSRDEKGPYQPYCYIPHSGSSGHATLNGHYEWDIHTAIGEDLAGNKVAYAFYQPLDEGGESIGNTQGYVVIFPPTVDEYWYSRNGWNRSHNINPPLLSGQ